MFTSPVTFTCVYPLVLTFKRVTRQNLHYSNHARHSLLVIRFKNCKGVSQKTKCIGSPNFSFLSRFSCDGLPRLTLASHEAFFGQQLSRRVNPGSLTLLSRTKNFGSSLPIHPNHKNIRILRLTQSPGSFSRRRISFTVHLKLHSTGVQI